jgi:predicted Fe-Mo cluster-binding NifX family protein
MEAKAAGTIGNSGDEEAWETKVEKARKNDAGFWKKGEGLKERIAVSTEDGTGLGARLSEHFGRVPYFIIVDLDENCNVLSVQSTSNESKHFGGVGQPSDCILQFNPHAVIAYGIEPKALTIFQQAKVAALRANANTVKEVVEAYMQDRLEELTEGCHQARRH